VPPHLILALLISLISLVSYFSPPSIQSRDERGRIVLRTIDIAIDALEIPAETRRKGQSDSSETFPRQLPRRDAPPLGR